MPRWRRDAPEEVEPPATIDEVELRSWGERNVIRLGESVDPTVLPGFVARLNGERAGLLSYAIRGDECEVVTVTSLHEGRGIARALAVYQRWGMDIAALHRHAVTEARRRLKPSLPERGASGIVLAHELELELRLK